MSAPAAPRDRDRRSEAVTTLGRNVVVTAGAGTGKTSLLVERLLVALGGGHATLETIAAITFTDKAAGELRHRLAAGLDSLSALASGGEATGRSGESDRAFAHLASSGVPTSAISERAGAATRALDAAAVTTIHGFCADILRSHPIEAGLPPGFSVARGPVVDRIAEDLWSEFVSEELGSAGARQAVWARALTAATMSDLATLGRDLARGGISAALLEGPYVASRPALGAAAAAIAETIRSPAARAAELTDAPRTWFEQAAVVLEILQAKGPEAARDARRHFDRLGKPVGELRGKNLGDDDKVALKRLASDAWTIVAGLDALDEEAARAGFEAVRPYAKRVREAFARAGLVDFDTLLVGARDLLRDRPAVREAQKARVRMLLLDEFQDTDPVQYEVVFLLAEVEGGAATDPWATRLAPGRLFIVGDAKQSIYRFRGADYAAYSRALEHVLEQGGLSVTLTANFRSVPGVIDPINALFNPSAGTAWRPSAALSPYAPVVAERRALPAPAVEIWTTPHARGGSGERRRAEATALAAEIAASCGQEPGRSHADFLVLFRSFTHLPIYVRALREAGIPFIVSGGKDFHERPEVVQALALLRAVDEPDDAVARLAFLRSPVGGVPDDELARFAGERDAWSEQPAVDPLRCPRVAEALATLGALRDGVANLPVDLRIRAVVERSGLPALSALAFDGAQRVANLAKLVNDASMLARDGRLTFRETIDALAERPRGEEEGESPLSDETADAVSLMTVHKAKGLEAPVVILADAAAGRRTSDPERAFRARAVRAGGAEAIGVSGPAIVNAASLLASLEDKRHEAAEDLRLLYVALTRARDRLVVFGGGRRAGAWTRALAPWGYDPAADHADGAALAGGLVVHRILDAAAPARAAPREAAVGAPEALAAYERACALAVESGVAFRSPSWFEDRGVEMPRETQRSPLDAPMARAVGSAVHARLERFDGDAGALLADLPAVAAGPAEEAGVDVNDVIREAAEILSAFAASPLAGRLAGLAIVGREVPVLLREDERSFWRGTIDLLYRDADGTLVVADYKTDRELAGAFARHREQLRVYVEAVRRAAPGIAVRSELWMLRHGTVV